MREYELSLDGYEITRWEYKELLAFCRQYEEKLERAEDLLHKTSASLNGMPRGCNTSDPVCAAVIQREKLLGDCSIINSAAFEVDPDVTNCVAIIRNVTQGVPYEQLQFHGSRATFFRMRRKFFFLLRNKKLRPWGNTNVL